jgi:hypothetical protein
MLQGISTTHTDKQLRSRPIRVRISPQWRKTSSITVTISKSCVSTSRTSPSTSSTSDPPFNSRQDYNVLFAEKDGTRSSSQIMAFEDTWEWNVDAERAAQNLGDRKVR